MEYQPNVKNITGTGGQIASVAAGSTGALLGLRVGDTLVAVGAQRLRDVIDYRFTVAEEQVELRVLRDGEEIVLQVAKAVDDDLGIDFTEPLFDKLRVCNNKCPFCFLTQMPKGLRKTLYLKDDDYRLGFLYGNFVTFTNLDEADWERIESQRLSPQYISVHATDRAHRAVMLGKADVPDVIAQIERLGRSGIRAHTQIVALPGINDGELLDRSIAELAALYPIVETIAVVPVGLTRYRFEGKRPQSIRTAIQIHEGPDWINTNHERQPLWDEGAHQQAALAKELGHCGRQMVATDVPMRCYEPHEAAALIDRVEAVQRELHTQHGINLVYASDEFYLLAGREVPAMAAYDGMPQYSNGVGMTRDLLDGWAKAQRRLPARLATPTDLVLVCGTLIAPTLQRLVDRLQRVAGLDARLLPVVNQFFGETVTVSGLLMGQDVVPVLRASGATRALLPRVMFDHSGERTIDEYSLARIAEESGVAVALAGEPDEVVRYVRGLASRR